MRVRPFLPAAVLILAPVLAACSDDADSKSPSSDPTPTQGTTTPSATETPEVATKAPTTVVSVTPEALPSQAAACDLVTSDDIAKAFGVSFGAGEPGTDTTSEGNLAWRSNVCSFEAQDLVEVTVKVTGTGDFTTGALTCAQPSDVDANVEPADDVTGATAGWWSVNSAPPLEATLRACSKTALVEVELDYEDGVDYQGDPRNQSASVAELVLAGLQG